VVRVAADRTGLLALESEVAALVAGLAMLVAAELSLVGAPLGDVEVEQAARSRTAAHGSVRTRPVMSL